MRADEQAYPSLTQMNINGLTIREAFVMAAMQGMCANPDWGNADVATEAVAMADATLSALEVRDED